MSEANPSNQQDMPLLDHLCKVLIRENQLVDHRGDVGLLPGNAPYKAFAS